ncbi:MAG TPA: glycosyltransferase [Steroidobacteraceae bacterium]|jgi:glycosyltransferase involved in cell wall biosynthesis|nr:glycosyltransferase [Steroidobacteraceae bacterium]
MNIVSQAPLSNASDGPITTEGPASVGIVHDWLTGYAGGEKVLEQILLMHPHAALYTTIDTLPDSGRAWLHGFKPVTTFAQRFPFMRKHYRSLLPILMLAVEQLDVSEHPLILSTSVSVARGILTSPDQLHIGYVHAPMRYAWDQQHQYLRESGLDSGLKGMIARWLLHKARIWDLRGANGVDYFIANSNFIARRIWKVYRRPAAVIYPPVDTEQFAFCEKKENFYLIVSRMVPYKKIPLIVEAFARMPDKKLIVVGHGPQMNAVKKVATKNVEILGFQPAEVVSDLMQRTRAFVFAAEEDFGIAPVEAQACGTPVIAFGRGGVLESIRGLTHARPTGTFFSEQTPAAIAQAVDDFERNMDRLEPQACRDNALRFSIPTFNTNYREFVRKRWDAFAAGERLPE